MDEEDEKELMELAKLLIEIAQRLPPVPQE